MNVKIPEPTVAASRGWLFYDGDCPLCAGAAVRFKSFLNRRGFEILPLQTPPARTWPGLQPGELPDEMKLLTDAGKIFGGADAAMEIARRTWWTWPLFALAQFPGAMILARFIYRRIAANRHCLNGTCRIQEKGKI